MLAPRPDAPRPVREHGHSDGSPRNGHRCIVDDPVDNHVFNAGSIAHGLLQRRQFPSELIFLARVRRTDRRERNAVLPLG